MIRFYVAFCCIGLQLANRSQHTNESLTEVISGIFLFVPPEPIGRDEWRQVRNRARPEEL